MAVADWEIHNPDATELRTDYVYEGERAVGFAISAEETNTAVHKQTLTDNPISGAIKSAVLFRTDTFDRVGFVFKYKDYYNFMCVNVFAPADMEIVKRVNGTDTTIAYDPLSTTLEPFTWYILEAIFNDEKDEIVFRIRDANENLLEEHIFTEIFPSEFKGEGGGIGLIEKGDMANFDLTKIYY